MELVLVTDASGELGAEYYERLEAGNVLYFPRSPLALSREDTEFLLSQRQAGSSYYKNIAYGAAEDRVTGLDAGGDRERMRRVLKDYCEVATGLLARLLPRYANEGKQGISGRFEKDANGIPAGSELDGVHRHGQPRRAIGAIRARADAHYPLSRATAARACARQYTGKVGRPGSHMERLSGDVDSPSADGESNEGMTRRIA